MSYHFFLGTFELPVPPSAMDISIKGKNKTIELANQGEVNIIKPTGLTEVSFSFMLPNNPYPFAKGGVRGGFLGALARGLWFRDTKSFLQGLKKMKQQKKPIRFLVSRNNWNHMPTWHTNLLCTIEEYTIKEDADNGTDCMIDITLKEYVPYGTKNVTVSKDKDGNETLTIESSNRFDDIADVPGAIKLTNQLSVMEGVQAVLHGGMGALDWQAVALDSGLTNPLQENLKGEVLKLGDRFSKKT